MSAPRSPETTIHVQFRAALVAPVAAAAAAAAVVVVVAVVVAQRRGQDNEE